MSKIISTHATRCLEAGMSPNTVSSLLGHGTIRMTLSYVHNSPEKVQRRCVFIE